jgi:hypothetical protein
MVKVKKNLFKWPLVVIWWEDAIHEFGETEAEADLSTPMQVTVGWLIKETKKKVTLVGEFQEGTETVRHKSSIPRQMIKRIERWDLV